MLWVLGDTHLSLAVDKKMDVFGGAWEGYTDKLRQNLSVISRDDTLVLCGDTSWGMNLTEALEDFRFLDEVPCKKLLVKGNHDYFWETANKMSGFFSEHGFVNYKILHNNAFLYETAAICGTRGWLLERDQGGDQKIISREAGRLRVSLEAGRRLTDGELIVFLHYPPVYEGNHCEVLTDILREYGVKRCYYGHLHGAARKRAIEGLYMGVDYKLISADHVNFSPVRVVI